MSGEIKHTGSFLRKTYTEFNRRWGAYIAVVFVPLILLTQFIIPFYQWLAEQILKLHGIPYLAQSTLKMFLEHPTSIILLLMLAAVVIGTVFLQFCFTLIGMKQIRNDSFRLKQLVKESLDTLLKYGAKSIPGLLFYFILLMPATGLIPHSAIFSKINLPNFITDVLFSNLPVALLFTAGYIVLLIVGIMRIYTLPLMILEKKTVAEAFKKSEQLTKGHRIKIFLRIMVISAISLGGSNAIYYLLYELQVYLESRTDVNALTSAVLVMMAIQILEMLFLMFSTIFLMFLIIPDNELETEEIIYKEKKRRTEKIIVSLAIGLIIVGFAINGIVYMFGSYDLDIRIIAHRGCDYDNKNGVQNVTSTMLKTKKTADPDYSELDIHETKDNKFIVFHDETMKNLTGKEGIPHDYTLDELLSFTASEFGSSSKLSSFDDYLKAADDAGQKLLIEIKETSSDSEDMMVRFVDQYGKDIIEHGHLIHSMGYDVVEALVGGFGADDTLPIDAVEKLRGFEPNGYTEYTGENVFFVSAIVPFNLIYAGTNGQAVSMEETFVDEHLIHTAHSLGQEVYVWTVDSEVNMRKLIFLGVDGIITDRPYALRNVLKEFSENTPYSERIKLYIEDNMLSR